MSEQSDPQFDAASAFPEVTALRVALAGRAR
jgi:hypothetical protein